VDKSVSAGEDEHQALLQGWEFVKNFLEQLKDRGDQGMSKESKDVVEEVDEHLRRYTSKHIGKTTNSRGAEVTPTLKKETDHTEDESDSASGSLRTTCEESGKSKEEVKIGRKTRKDDYWKTLPPMECYDEMSGQGLEEYLVRFEEYCRESYRGGSFLWIAELEKMLSGRILEGMRSLRQPNEGYYDIKRKLLSWYSDEQEYRKKRAKLKFQKVQPKPNETMFIYSNRLESIFKMAYPKHKVHCSSTLITKFKESVPKKMTRMVNDQELNHKMKDQKLRWQTVQKCARLFDLDVTMSKKSSDDEISEPKEITINMNECGGSEWQKHRGDGKTGYARRNTWQENRQHQENYQRRSTMAHVEEM